MVIRAADSALVLLSSHLNLSSPAFYLWRACLPASSPLESGCLWRLHVALVAFCPCLFLALVCLWPLRYFLVSLARSTCGAHSWGVSLFGSCPLVGGVAGSPPFVFLSALSMCLVRLRGSGVFSWCLRFSRFARSSRTGCLALFFFLRPLLFRFFLVQIPWLCCAFVVVPAGVFFSPVAFLPWPAFLSLGPRVS